VLSPRGSARQSPELPHLAAEPGPRFFQRARSTLTGVETPRAFHGFNQRLGTNRRGSIEGQRLAGTTIEGSHRPFDLCAPSHPCAKRMTTGPVRALRLPVAGQYAPRGEPRSCCTTRHFSPPRSTHFRTPRLASLASSCSEPPRNTLLALRPSSGRIAEMLQIRFYNRRFASRAPAVKPPSLETSRRAPWETRRRSPSRSSSNMTLPPLFAEDAGPPRGHPASSGVVLDGTLPASGRQAVAPRFRASRGKRSSFFGCLRALPVEPSDTLSRMKRGRRTPFLPSSSPLPRQHVNAPALASPGCLPPGKSRTSTLAGTCAGALRLLADRRRSCTCSSMFENFD
jgi:hypothetical protein